jgi:hypothetical protein
MEGIVTEKKKKKTRKQMIDGDMSIDPHQLDKEWLSQPNKYFRYAAKLADARTRLDEAKSSFDVVKAELDLAVRRDPSEFGLEKLTEKALEAVVVSQDLYGAAQNDVFMAKHEVEVLSAAVSALDHRKKALENMVTLHMANYYSTPRAKGESKESVEEFEKRAVRTRGKRKSE